jgi:hypothetical protein
VEIEFSLLAIDVGYDSVTCVVASSATSANVGLSGEDVDKFTLACRIREEREVSRMSSWGRIRCCNKGDTRSKRKTGVDPPSEALSLAKPFRAGSPFLVQISIAASTTFGLLYKRGIERLAFLLIDQKNVISCFTWRRNSGARVGTNASLHLPTGPLVLPGPCQAPSCRGKDGRERNNSLVLLERVNGYSNCRFFLH